MKRIFFITMFFFGLYSCGEPVRITANPDNTAATSGTLGSARAENQLPASRVDTTKMGDTIKIKRNRLQ